MDELILELGLLEDDAIVLDVAALQLASLDHPDEEIDDHLNLLGNIAERLAPFAARNPDVADRASALAAIIAGEFSFLGDRDNYDHPDNADLIRVIERRRGLPVSLSLLYVAAARRVGWHADALNTPGHVLVRIGSASRGQLIDPFNSGEPVGPDVVDDLMRAAFGANAIVTAEEALPMSNRAILVRLLTNQATRAEAAGEPGRALVLLRRITTIAPSYGETWWNRARLELVGADVAGARASLSAGLEVTRDPEFRKLIRNALESIARSPRGGPLDN